MAQKKKKQSKPTTPNLQRLKKLLLLTLILLIVDTLAPHVYQPYRQHRNKALTWIRKLVGPTITHQTRQLVDSLQNFKPFSSTPKHPIIKAKLGKAITIASFNIRIYSNKSRDDQELQQIAAILERYDLIAVQEVRDETVIQRTLAILRDKGLDYDYMISRPVGKSVKERYAFIYKAGIIEIKQKGQIYPDPQNHFIREPYYATFKAGQFDFTLATIHVLFGNSKKHRRPEIKQLAEVYTTLQQQDSHEQDIIILGDFNFGPRDEGFQALLACSNGMCALIHNGKTTIGDKSLYDNFFFDQDHLTEYTGKSSIFEFDKHIYKNDLYTARKAVSDHRPIWGEFLVTRDDD